MIELPPSQSTPGLNDIDYQDWLARPDIGLVQRSRNLSLFKDLEQSQPDRFYKSRHLLGVLISNRGYMNAWDSFAALEYPNQPLIESKANVRQLFKTINDAGLSPLKTIWKRGIGIAAGIDLFILTRTELNMLYLLWQNRTRSVSMPKLMGKSEEDVFDYLVPAVRTHISSIRKKLNTGSDRIKSTYIGYRLVI
jgi:hypothetical protein